VRAESASTQVDIAATRRASPLLYSMKIFAPLAAALIVVTALVIVPKTTVNAGERDALRSHAVAHTSEPTTIFPIGTTDAAEPSGEGPPAPTSFPGYTETYEEDFTGTDVPTGWSTFGGTDTIDADTGEQFAPSHDVVANGVLSLNTFMDPVFANQWVTGGICRCQDSNTYGAFLVRSRQTGPGPTGVDLLWPTTNTWPPEIDFNETVGVTDGTTATVIWGDAGGQRQQSQASLNIDMTQWHTWGVVWSPTSILYTVDGNVWGEFDVPSEIPNVPMNLHLQTQTWCVYNYACPTGPQSTLVDWVAEYSAVPNYSETVGTFAPSSWAVSSNLRTQISGLAATIAALGDSSISLVGYSDSRTVTSRSSAVSENRAQRVKSFLLQDLVTLNDGNVDITVAAGKKVKPSTFTSSPAWRARSATVAVTLHNPTAG
jgi:outer membrane protein OmpA-like peptidoglycan-associated protein